MDLFNKRKIEKLNKELKELEKEKADQRLTNKDLVRTIAENDRAIKNLQEENEKLRNWILIFLDINGQETDLHIPYERTVVPITINEQFCYNSGLDLEPPKCERIFVPALDIRKFKNG